MEEAEDLNQEMRQYRTKVVKIEIGYFMFAQLQQRIESESIDNEYNSHEDEFHGEKLMKICFEASDVSIENMKSRRDEEGSCINFFTKQEKLYNFEDWVE